MEKTPGNGRQPTASPAGWKKKAEDLHACLIENLSVAAFVLNADHEVVVWNKACEELTGVKAEAVIGTRDHWRPFYSEKRPTLADMIIDGNFEEMDGRYAAHCLSRLVNKGLEAEGWFRDLGGADRYMLFSAAPSHDPEGRLLFVTETFQDITSRKKLEEALKESESRLRMIIETEPQCVKLLAPDGALLAMNPSGLAMIEADSFEQVKGRQVSGLVMPEYRGPFKALMNSVFKGEPASLEFEIIGLKGTPRRLSTQALPFRDATGRIVALLGITTDITRQTKLEEQLRHAQKMEAVGQLAGGIAHDFNNILSAIIGYADLLEARVGEDSPLKNYVNNILSASNRAAQLVKSLLTFSRKQNISLRPVELNALVKGIEKLLLGLIREDIELVVRRSGDDLVVMADSGQIEQVLMNLVANARDAMPAGGFIVIQAGTAELKGGRGNPAAGRHAVISVTDTGTGMEAQTIERIFDPFFTTKEAGKGTGLGLSVTYGIIEQHGGRIDVQSEPGIGTSFSIYLPLMDVPEAMGQKGGLPDRDGLRGGPETILVAEDDVILRQLTSAVLREYGYTVIEAENGLDAVEKFTANRKDIQLAVLDVIMPKMGGKEASEQIRRIGPSTEVIFMSGYAPEVIGGSGLGEAGMKKDKNFILKPVAPGVLVSKVREVLDRKTP